MGEQLVGGRLKNYLPFWKTLTSDNYILQLVAGAKLEFNCPVRQNVPRPQIRCSHEDKYKIDLEVNKYLNSGIIERANHSQGEYVSQIFPVPKKTGGLRIILNLKPLNLDIVYKHFKMENLNTVLNLVEQDCFMASIDLQDAYYSVNINTRYRKCLRFLWNGQLFQFTCLPNGLSSAPRWFTKLLKPVFANLRNQGYISVYFLDDTWLMGKTKDDCYLNVVATQKMLTDAGFLINVKKSKEKFTYVLTTDASLLGWGAVHQKITTGGHWAVEESKFHINVLELMAILFGLKSLLPEIANSHI